MSVVQHPGEAGKEQPGPLHGLTVAHVGHFDPGYSRNRIMAKALHRAGATVLTVSERRTYVHRTPRIARELLRVRPDLVLVGYPGHADVAISRLAGVTRRTPVILDAFVSLYETEVEDRQLVRPGSTAARRYALEDQIACRLATRVVLDTDTHLEFFAERLGVPRRKLRRVWVGADDDVMRPGPPPDDTVFRVFVYGSFVPLHGLEHVVRAAHVLDHRGEKVEIDIVGDGQTGADVRRLADELELTNVRFLGRRPYEELPDLMAASHVCLGIFGTSGKARRVVPNKVFDALAVARPILTADTPAAREILTHGHDAWLCPPGDPEALAGALTALKADPPSRARLAEHGHRLFRERFSIDALSRELAVVMLDAIGRSATT